MDLLGLIFLSLGTLLMALGGLYLLLDWRYGGAIFYWSLMWGLMAVGLGLALMGARRRWRAVAGAFTCLISVAMTAYWHHFALLDASWLWGIGIGCATGIVYGATAAVRHSLALRRARGR